MLDSKLHRRDLLRGLLTGSAALLAARTGFAQDASPPIQATQLADRLWVLMGDGGNVAMLAGDDGWFMVDGGLANRADDLAQAIAKLSDKPVVTLFDTHWHLDHVGSNVLLGGKGARIMAQDNVKARLSTKQTMEALNMSFDPLPAAGLPTVTFPQGGTKRVGVETIQYHVVPPAHTDGDTYLFFHHANVLHTGDLFFNGFYPVIDYSSKGWMGGMIAAKEKLLKIGNAQTKIIPGHGPIATRADLQAAHDMLKTVHSRLEPMAKQGKSVDEVIAAKPTQDLDGKWGNGFLKPEMFVKIAYTSMQRHSG